MSIESGDWALADSARVFLIALLLMVGQPQLAFAWGNEGHRIVAFIAADHLGVPARSRIAKLLAMDAADWRAIAERMADDSILPDWDYRREDPPSAAWHYINLCLQDTESEIPARCVRGQCATAKIGEFTKRLSSGNYDRWGAEGDLAFLVHIIGDIHQPLHAATNADLGGNCVRVREVRVATLHLAWDDTMVRLVMARFAHRGHNNARNTASALESYYAMHPFHDGFSWRSGGADALAWESNRIALAQIYERLAIPLEPCEPNLKSCSRAPAKVRAEDIVLDPAYLSAETEVAALQLFKAGTRLAALLNQIWQ
ncbi:MAG TPA: S1/P1 nuclease [Candidatus Binataceae bacterium]|nr:S1/P1 nuclease [Candidatus Binataceae bacterium]